MILWNSRLRRSKNITNRSKKSSTHCTKTWNNNSIDRNSSSNFKMKQWATWKTQASSTLFSKALKFPKCPNSLSSCSLQTLGIMLWQSLDMKHFLKKDLTILDGRTKRFFLNIYLQHNRMMKAIWQYQMKTTTHATQKITRSSKSILKMNMMTFQFESWGLGLKRNSLWLLKACKSLC